MSEYVFNRDAVRRFHFTDCAFDAATGSVPKKLLLREMERLAQKVNKNMKAELIERMLKDSGIQ